MMYMYYRIGFIFIFSIAFLSISCQNKRVDDRKIPEERVLESSEGLVSQQVNKVIRNGDNKKFEILITEIKDIEGVDKVIQSIDSVRKLIENQGDDFDVLYYSGEDGIDNAIVLYPHWLVKHGYIFPSENEYKQKLKDYFNISRPYMYNIIDHENFFTYLTPRDELTKDYRSFPQGAEWDSSYKNVFFGKERHFLMLLSELGILAELTGKGQYQTMFSYNLLHYNKFIFNDNQASLMWLIQNDISFLELLVTEFGYDKNKKLNKAVIESIYKKFDNLDNRSRTGGNTTDYAQLQDFFFKKNLYKKIDVREGIMETIVGITTKKDKEYLDCLEQVGDIIAKRSRGYSDVSVFDDYTEEEKLYVLSYICYYVEKAYIKNDVEAIDRNWNGNWSVLKYQLRDTPQLLPTLKANNYFNLPDYAEMVQKRLDELENE